MATKLKTRVWDSAEHLQDEEAVRLYIEAAQEEAPDDAAFMATVLGDVARARNISELSRSTGIARETLYKVTRGEGNPTLDTIGKLANALGFRLSLVPLSTTTVTTNKTIRAGVKVGRMGERAPATGQFVQVQHMAAKGASSHRTTVRESHASAGKFVAKTTTTPVRGRKVPV